MKPLKYFKDTSSNVNEVIRAVLKSFFFYEKISHVLKALKAQKVRRHNQAKAQKHKNANKRISHFFPLRCFLSA